MKNYVIETDELRKLVSTPQINYTADTEKISIGINNNINKKIWDMVYTLAEDRMKQGETIAIDATFYLNLLSQKFVNCAANIITD